MATTVKVRPSNGVSFGVVHTVTSADQSAGAIIFDFTPTPITAGVTGTFLYDIVGVIAVLSSANAVLATTGAAITYPDKGQIEIANGGAFSLTAGQIINLIVQRNKSVTP